MKASTQSCSGKMCSQNLGKTLKKHQQRSPFSSKAIGLNPATLPKKSPPQPYPAPELFLLHFRMAASVVNTVGNLTFHWSKKKKIK